MIYTGFVVLKCQDRGIHILHGRANVMNSALIHLFHNICFEKYFKCRICCFLIRAFKISVFYATIQIFSLKSGEMSYKQPKITIFCPNWQHLKYLFSMQQYRFSH